MSNLPQCAVARNIDPAVWSALKNSIYPGAHDDSIAMVWDYCSARTLDPLLKPVHLVPMTVEDKQTKQKSWRDVVMPGIGLYRIQADRSGNYAGASAPQFGPDITESLDGLSVTYPEWCEVSMQKLIGDRLVSFTAREYWKENYATAGRETAKPNSMWFKRPRGQIVKCATAQALRAGWPEIGSQPTAEEMEGKDLITEKDITPPKAQPLPAEPVFYSKEDFAKNLPSWTLKIKEGKSSADHIASMVKSKAPLTEQQIETLRALEPTTIDNATGEAA